MLTVSGLHKPMDVAVGPDGHFCVTEWETGFVADIDRDTGAIRGRVAIPQLVSLVPCRSDGSRWGPGLQLMQRVGLGGKERVAAYNVG